MEEETAAEKIRTLSLENYSTGFLVDDEFLAGVSENPDAPGAYLSFLVKQETGEVISLRNFEKLEDALKSVNELPRDWSYEKIGCGGGGGCGGHGDGGCGGHGSGGCGGHGHEHHDHEGHDDHEESD